MASLHPLLNKIHPNKTSKTSDKRFQGMTSLASFIQKPINIYALKSEQIAKVCDIQH